MLAFFNKNEGISLPDGVWPKAKIVAALKRRYSSVDDLGEESGYDVYGVTDGEIRFAVVMALVAGAPDKVSEVGFLARFSGFNLSQPQLESVNRNLHISIAAFNTDGDLYLIGGVSAEGAFNEGTFTLILEAWKRDLLVILQSMSLSHMLADAVPMARLDAVRRFAVNAAPADAGAGDLFTAFAGGAHRALSVCINCAGRGKTGFLARQCGECSGSGFVALGRPGNRG
jgi:hypothetical protein